MKQSHRSNIQCKMHGSDRIRGADPGVTQVDELRTPVKEPYGLENVHDAKRYGSAPNRCAFRRL